MIKKALLVGIITYFAAGTSLAGFMDQEANVISISEIKKSNFSTSFFSIISINNMKPGKDQPQHLSERLFDSYEYLSVNYKLNTDSKASLRLPFLMSTAGMNEYGDQKPGKIALSDIHFAYSNYDLGYIGDIDLAGNIKLFLPTSAYSQAAKTIAKLRFEGFFEWKLGRYSSLEYAVKPDIFFQSQTAFFNAEDIPQYEDGTFMRDPRSTNKQFSLEHYLQLNMSLNKYLTLTPKIGFDEDWYYASAAEQLEGGHVTKCRVGLGLLIRPLRRVNFTLGVQNDTPLGSNRGNDIAFFQPENTQYSLMTNAFVF